MPKNKNITLHSAGYIFAGNDDVYDPTEFSFTIGWEKVEASLKNGIYVIPTGQPMRVRAVFTGFSPDLLSRLTGGTLSAGCLRIKEETLTKAYDAGDDRDELTLSQTPADTNAIRVQPVGGSAAPLVQVASVSAVGEYQVIGTTIVLHSSQSQTQFAVTYLYNDATNGDNIQINPNHLPSTFKLFGAVPAEDLFTGVSGWMVIECSKVQRDSELVLGGSKGSALPLEVEFNVINTAPGDVKIHVIAE